MWLLLFLLVLYGLSSSLLDLSEDELSGDLNLALEDVGVFGGVLFGGVWYWVCEGVHLDCCDCLCVVTCVSSSLFVLGRSVCLTILRSTRSDMTGAGLSFQIVLACFLLSACCFTIFILLLFGLLCSLLCSH